MIRFVFFGRLSHEKGIDLVLETFLELALTRTDRSLDIYGAGPYADACHRAALQYPDAISFHGRTQQATIREQLPTYTYCLMTSRVIETFGKSALESLNAGVQIIGYRHGGLSQFIDPSLAIGAEKNSLSSLVSTIIDGHILPPPIPDLSKYNAETRITQFKCLAEPSRSSNVSPHSDQVIKPRVLLVSDFISRNGGGGIETFLYETAALLHHHGYEVELCGAPRSVGFWGLFATACNIRERWRVRSTIDRFHPHIVRYHSTLRRMGWLPMTCAPYTKTTPDAQKRRMVHDMGYVYPHPAQLSNLSSIPARHTLTAWLATVRHRNFLVKILTVAKRTLHKIISFVVRDFNQILIPSEFMRPYVHQMAPHSPIQCLPHFITK